MNLALTKKKLIILFTFVAICSLTTYYYFGVYKSISNVSLQASYIDYDTLEELSSGAELIVIASPTEDFKNREHKSTFYKSGKAKVLQDIYTLTDIKIDKVIKGPSNIPDTIKIVEPIGLLQEYNGLKKVAIEDYTELKKNNKYIIFLSKNTYGVYGIINMQNGRFNLDNQDKDDSKSKKEEIRESMRTEIYKRFKGSI